MLKKKQRLNLAIRLESPELFKNSFFTLLVSKNGLSYSRYGFVASKKNDKRAVERNRVKRLFSSVLQKEIKIKSGYDMIFILKKDSFLKKPDEVEVKITEVLKKRRFI